MLDMRPFTVCLWVDDGEGTLREVVSVPLTSMIMAGTRGVLLAEQSLQHHRSTLSSRCEAFCRIAAGSDHPVLLTGRTGAGKTFLARKIHERSARSAKPFVALNCASLPDNLCERELFGHVRGAFTDAKDSAPGIFEAADGGTLLLDEIGDMPVHLQGKLLDTLEAGLVRRIGSVRVVRVDVRIISATNRNLHDQIAERAFREDLFYRLAVLTHDVTGLAGHRGSTAKLIVHFLNKHSGAGEGGPGLSHAAGEALLSYRWPGNIRELENAIRHALAYAGTEIIEIDHLPPDVVRPPQRGRFDKPTVRYSSCLDHDDERAAMIAALDYESGNRTRAAKRMGMSRSAFWMKMKILDVSGAGKDRSDHRVEPLRD